MSGFQNDCGSTTEAAPFDLVNRRLRETSSQAFAATMTMARDVFVRTRIDLRGHIGWWRVPMPRVVGNGRARRIAATTKPLGIARFEMKYSAGHLAHENRMRSIEVFGNRCFRLAPDMLAWRRNSVVPGSGRLQ